MGEGIENILFSKEEVFEMRRSTSNVIWGMLTGAIVGAASALLLAPKSGSETRKQLKDQFDLTKEKAKQTRGRMSDRMGEVRGKAQEMRERVASRMSEARERAQAVGARASQKKENRYKKREKSISIQPAAMT